jgi:hypothetical protein
MSTDKSLRNEIIESLKTLDDTPEHRLLEGLVLKACNRLNELGEDGKGKPKGVIGILIDNTGRVICSADDYELGGYGGFNLWESQKVRVRQKLSLKLRDSWFPDFLRDSEVVYHGDLETFIDRLITKRNYRIHYEFIGHDPDTL